MKTLLRLIRPRQWVKNSLVFAALIFSQRFTSIADWRLAILAFIAFSLVASGIYIINDILDREEDRRHPVKCRRPIAAGEVKIGAAIGLAAVLLLVGLLLGWSLNPPAFAVLLGYAVVMILYSIHLKRVLLLDVFIIACGLTARAVFGAEVIDVEISRWLLVCTFFIALTLAMSKRRTELARIGDERDLGRQSLLEAPPMNVWDHWIGMVSGITVLAYTLYTMDPLTVSKVGSTNLLFTVPFVAYGIFRYQYIIHVGKRGEDPADILLRDKWILATVAIWLVVVLLILGS